MKLVPLVLMLCATSYARVDGDRSRRGIAVQLSTFKTALQAFYEDCGRFPSTADGLAALTTRPAEISETQWRGPDLLAGTPKDPWGHDYVYQCPGEHNPNSFDLYSLGADGVSKSGGDDADDIGNWPQRRAHE